MRTGRHNEYKWKVSECNSSEQWVTTWNFEWYYQDLRWAKRISANLRQEKHINVCQQTFFLSRYITYGNVCLTVVIWLMGMRSGSTCSKSMHCCPVPSESHLGALWLAFWHALRTVHLKQIHISHKARAKKQLTCDEICGSHGGEDVL